MKDSFAVLGKQGRKVLVVGMLVSGLTACAGHHADPTRTRLPTYDMPAAVVVQTPPVRLNGVGHTAIASAGPHYMAGGQFARPVGGNTVAASSTGYTANPHSAVPQTMARADGSTVIQQSPSTVKRPSIVVPQQPVWVGKTTMPIP